MAIYGEKLYAESIYSGAIYTGQWENSYSFTYLAGTSVFVTLDVTQTQPEGTEIKYYAGQSTDEYELIETGVKSPVLFTDKASGSQNLYIKIVMTANSSGTLPSIDTVDVLIEQQTSLYTSAVSVLSDGLTDSGVDYYIDPWLQNVLIDYSFFDKQSHRSALALIGDACGGVAYQDRRGVVRVESAGYLQSNGETEVFEINRDRILEASTPVSEVFNVIRITTQPYEELSSQTVWELQGDNLIDNGESRTFEVFFNDYKAVNDAAAVLTSTPAGATIDSETWYTWGGRITVTGTADEQELTLSATGNPLAIRGSRVVEESDGASIRLNGERVYTIAGNQLIQDPIISEEIAEAVLSTTKNARRDIDITWRGDPTLELGDLGKADGQTGYIVEQDIQYNGILSAKSLIRRK